MKNVIYQYWDGQIAVGCRAGIENMKAYAKRINAKYIFEHNPNYFPNIGTQYSKYYGAFRPVYDDKFSDYDNVLFADTDIFSIDSLTENIFENFSSEIGVCEEATQPELRLKTASAITSQLDNMWMKLIKDKWGVVVPRTKNGLMKVYNSGVVLYSNQGLRKARKKFIPFQEYIDTMKKNKMIHFYSLDQPYLHAMLEIANMDWVELDLGWNSYIHQAIDKGNPNKYLNDTRTKNTKFVHIQLRGADDWNADKLYRVTNLPESEWDIK